MAKLPLEHFELVWSEELKHVPALLNTSGRDIVTSFGLHKNNWHNWTSGKYRIQPIYLVMIEQLLGREYFTMPDTLRASLSALAKQRVYTLAIRLTPLVPQAAAPPAKAVTSESRSPRMDRRTRRVIVRNAVRWASNMIVEVLHNHGVCLNGEEREALKRVTAAITDFDLAKEKDDF